MSKLRPPVNYLLTCSEPSLESFELARLNHIANFRKQIREIVDEWIAAEVEARLARWVLDQRRGQDQGAISSSKPEAEPIPFRLPGRKSALPAADAENGSAVDVTRS